MSSPRPEEARPNPFDAVRADHDCFGCGARNPIGLKLRFVATEDGVSAPFLPLSVHQGYDDIVHGGIISTLMDEAMAWAVARRGIWAVTGDIRVRFRSPLRVGQPTTVAARVTDDRGRVVSTVAELTLDGDGRRVASAFATFVRVDKATEAAWRARYLIDDDAQ